MKDHEATQSPGTKGKEHAEKSPETVMVHTIDGIFMKDVATLKPLGLIDLYEEHLHFVTSAVRITNEICMSGDCDGPAEYLPPILAEVERRLEYLQSIGNDMFRRLTKAENEKTA